MTYRYLSVRVGRASTGYEYTYSNIRLFTALLRARGSFEFTNEYPGFTAPPSPNPGTADTHACFSQRVQVEARIVEFVASDQIVLCHGFERLLHADDTSSIMGFIPGNIYGASLGEKFHLGTLAVEAHRLRVLLPILLFVF